MTYIVEVRYSESDWADLIADMRSWLDRRQIEVEGSNYSSLGRDAAIWVSFRDENDAAAFAEAFGSRLQFADPHGGAAQGGMHRSPGDEPAPSVSTLSPDRPTPSDYLLPEKVQPNAKAPQAGVSLMITRRQKADLRELGYSDDQIRDMKPKEVHRVLGLIEQQPPSTSARRRRSSR
ncbi:MAG: hypothetical protein WA459_00465 [Stellaceae bacterium]